MQEIRDEFNHTVPTVSRNAPFQSQNSNGLTGKTTSKNFLENPKGVVGNPNRERNNTNFIGYNDDRGGFRGRGRGGPRGGGQRWRGILVAKIF